MKKIIAILLLIVGVFLIYQGVTSFSETKEILSVGELEIKAQAGDNTQSIMYMVVGALSALGSIFLLKK